MDTEKAILDLSDTLMRIAIQERNRFIQENRREPTESEAKRITEMIMTQLKIAHTMLK